MLVNRLLNKDLDGKSVERTEGNPEKLELNALVQIEDKSHLKFNSINLVFWKSWVEHLILPLVARWLLFVWKDRVIFFIIC